MSQLKILEIPHFLTEAECREYIDMSEEAGYELAKVNFGDSQVNMPGVRNNQRYMHMDVDMAQRLWEKLKEHVPEKLGNSTAIGLNELIRFYKYKPGQRFRRHRDGSYIRNEMEASYYTFMVYLNEDFEGGTTTFTDCEIIPETGKALIFLHDLFHEGTAVTTGKKYVLRTDIMYRINL